METVDAERKKKYLQVWSQNMSKVDKPKITSCSTKPYTRVSFTPDYPRFGMQGLTDDTVAVFEKRVYDLAASTPSDLVVSWNGETIKLKGFDKYVDYFVGGNKSDAPRVYEKFSDRWEVAVAVSPDGHFNQISFVNGISTTGGGKHVDYIANQVTKKLVDHVEKKRKKALKQSYIKDNIWIFINCVIENPSFSSQLKVSSSEIRTYQCMLEEQVQRGQKVGKW